MVSYVPVSYAVHLDDELPGDGVQLASQIAGLIVLNQPVRWYWILTDLLEVIDDDALRTNILMALASLLRACIGSEHFKRQKEPFHLRLREVVP